VVETENVLQLWLQEGLEEDDTLSDRQLVCNRQRGISTDDLT